ACLLLPDRGGAQGERGGPRVRARGRASDGRSPARSPHGLRSVWMMHGGIEMRTLVSVILACSLVTGCAVGPAYERPPLSIPEKMRGQAETPPAAEPGTARPAAGARESESIADQAWWDVFRDDTLKSLIEEALRNGYDVQLAAWRVEEARANAGI